MTFTRLGRILAVIAIVLGVLRITMAVIAINSEDPVSTARVFLGSKSTGYYIDQGIYWLVFGIVVGVLTDISKSLISFRETNVQDGSK